MLIYPPPSEKSSGYFLTVRRRAARLALAVLLFAAASSFAFASDIQLTLSPLTVGEGDGETDVTVTAAWDDSGPRSVDTIITISTFTLDADEFADANDFTTSPIMPFDITIPANALSVESTFSLTPTNDTVYEGDEGLVVVGLVSGFSVGGTYLAIIDDDVGDIKLTLTDLTAVGEEDGETSVEVTATWDGTPSSAATDVTVSVDHIFWATSEVNDFTAVTDFTITIPADTQSQTGTFDFTPTSDLVYEGDETVTVKGTTTGFTVESVDLTITDDETAPTTINLTLTDSDVGEGDGETSVAVTAAWEGTTPIEEATEVTVSVAAGTAEANDFTAVADFTITIPANTLSQTVTFDFTPTNDSVYEDDETVTVSGTASGLTVNSVDLTITDNETAPTTINLTLTDSDVGEEDGLTSVEVTAAWAGTTPREEATVVTVSVAAGTAEANDFTAVTDFTLTIAGGSLSQTGTFDFTPTNDLVYEDDETVTVSGTTTGFTVESADLTITDNETVPTTINLTLTDSDVGEEDGLTSVEVTAAWEGTTPREEATVVTVSVAAGTAEANDFTAVTDFTITIAGGSLSQTGTFDFTPTNDNVDEPDETVTVSGTTTDTEITVNSVDLTITDNDVTPTTINLTLSPSAVGEGAGLTSVEVTAAWAGASTRLVDTTVTVSVAAGTGQANDFTAVTDFDVIIAATTQSKEVTFSFEPTNDNVDEPDETVTVSGTVTGFTVNSVDLTITDNDDTPTTINLTLSPSAVGEGAGLTSVEVTAAWAGASTRLVDTTVTVSVAAGTGQANDFTAVTDFDVIIAATTQSKESTFSFEPTNDNVDEPDETVTVSGTVTGFTVNSVDLTITDNDDTPTTINLTLSPSAVGEGAGLTSVEVTAAWAGASTRLVDTTVTVSVAAGTGQANDFTAVTDFDVIIAATTQSKESTFSFTPTNDLVYEGDETVTVSGTTTGFTVNSATLTITDDDADDIKLTLSPSTVDEEDGLTSVEVTAAWVGTTSPRIATVTVSVAALTAEADDFTAVPSFTITIPANTQSQTGTFDFTPTNDLVYEGDETVTVSGRAARLTVEPATLTITDNEVAPTTIKLTLTDSTVDEEGGLTRVEVTAAWEGSTPIEEATEVEVSVAALTAETDDFTAVADFFITIAGGSLSQTGTFDFTPTSDLVYEDNETVTVSGKSSVHLTVESATLTITDDEVAPTTIKLTLSPSDVGEEDGETTVTVTAAWKGTTPIEEATAVTVSVDALTAEADDFEAVTDFTITIAGGSLSQTGTFDFTPTNDLVYEGDETVTVSGTGSEKLAVNSAILTIIDNDVGDIKLTLSPSTVGEEDGLTTVTVTATWDGTPSSAATDVTVSVAALTAETDDFTAVTDFTITIPADTQSQTGTFDFTPTNDLVYEGDETVTVSGAATGLTVEPATLTITDNEVAPTTIKLTLTDSDVGEEDGATTVTVTAAWDGTTPIEEATEVTVSVDALTAETTDFEAVTPFTITIAGGSFSQTGSFNITPTSDLVYEGDETVTVSGTASGFTVEAVALTITDNEVAPTTITLTLTDSDVGEEDGLTNVVVTAAWEGTTPIEEATEVEVSVAVGTGTAEANDFTAVADFTLTIAGGSFSQTGSFNITPTSDLVYEGDETVTVSGTATGYTVEAVALTITDNEVAPTTIKLTLTDSDVGEEDGLTNVVVTAAWDGTTPIEEATEVTVSVAVGTGTAEANDFTAVADFTITIPADTQSQTGTFDFTPTNDLVYEGDETVTVSGLATGFTVEAVALTITDNEVAPTTITLTLIDSDVGEEDGLTNVVVTAAWDGTTPIEEATEVTVSVAVGTGTAEANDFTAVADFTITIAGGSFSQTGSFNITPTSDLVYEGDETVTVSGTATGYTVEAVALTITDNEVAPTTITLTLTDSDVGEEDGATTVTVTAAWEGTTPIQEATEVEVSVAVGTGEGAAETDDFAAVADFTITIAGGALNKEGTFSFTPTSDLVYEGDETVTVSGTASGFTVEAVALTITDNETAPTTINLTLIDSDVGEEDGLTNVVVTAAWEGTTPIEEATEVEVSVAVGTGTAEANDFTAVADFTITIAGGSLSQTGSFNITPTSDLVYEGDETVTVSGTATGYTVEAVALTITDNETAPTTITLTLIDSDVGEEDGLTNVVVTAAWDGTTPIEEATEVTVSVAVGTGTAEANDFAAVADFTITIAGGSFSQTGSFNITPTSDLVYEGDETVTVSGTASGFTVEAVALTITDNEVAPTTITLTLTDSDVGEEDGLTNVVVTAAWEGTTPIEEATEVEVSVAVGTGTAEANDFTAVADFTITIAGGSFSQTGSFNITPTSDLVYEGDETVTVSGTATGYTVEAVALTITDNEVAPTTIKLTLTDSDVGEEDGLTNVVVTAAWDGTTPIEEATEVTVSVDALTAEANDFTAVADFTITIAGGSLSQTGSFNITPTSDLVYEGDETVTVSGTASGLTVEPVTLTITDNEVAPTTITLTLIDSDVGEEDGLTNVVVTAAWEGTTPIEEATDVTVSVAVGTGTAEANDFGTVADVTITIAGGSLSQTGSFNITPTSDLVNEGDETVTVSGVATGYTVNSVALTITDDDAAPTTITLTLGDSAVGEGGGATTVTVTATWVGTTSLVATTVTVSVAADTAQANDFGTVADVTITIPAATQSKDGTFNFMPLNDLVYEGDETVTVSGVATGYTVEAVALTITDDETAPTTITLALTDSDVGEEDGATTVTVTAAWDGTTPIEEATEVEVSVAVGTGTAEANDFTAVADFTITIAGGSLSQTGSFNITPTSDLVYEGDETVTVSGTATGYTVEAVALTITDNETAPTTITLTLIDSDVGEEDGLTNVVVTAAWDGTTPIEEATEVTVSVAVGTGTAEANDFAAVADFTITIAGGSFSQTGSFNITPTSDLVYEGDETVTVSGLATGFTVEAVALTITDNEVAPTTITLTLIDSDVGEEDGLTNVVVTAAWEGTTPIEEATDVTVSVAVGTGTAEANDFAAVADFTITIAGGSFSQTGSFNITPTSDLVYEGDETVTVSGTATGYTVEAVALTITDNEVAPTTITLTLTDSDVGEEDGLTNVVVTAAWEGTTPIEEATEVEVSVAVGTGTAEANDFTAVADFTITIAGGSFSQTGSFNITPTSDLVYEGDETVTVSGTATGYTVEAVALTITDNEVAPTTIKLTLTDSDVGEEDGLTNVVVTAAWDGTTPIEEATEVTVSVDALTAEANDFEAVTPFTITIAGGSLSQTGSFNITPTSDLVYEGDETVTVSGTASGFTVEAVALTITDNETAPTTINLTLIDSDVGEEDGLTNVVVKAAWDGTSTRAVDTMVTISVAAGTGTAEDTDFAAVADFTITIAGGALNKEGTFSFTPTSDLVYEGDETVTVSGVATGYTVEAVALTITDDETAPTTITLALTDSDVGEEDGATTVTVTAAWEGNTPIQEATEVTVSVDALTAETDDFTAVTDFTITIAGGSLSQTRSFNITPTSDLVYEGDETVTVSGTATGFTVNSVALTITDDETAPTTITLALTDSDVGEEDGATTVTVTAAWEGNTPIQEATEVEVSVAVGTGEGAAETDDFAAVADFTITIAGGALNKEGTFSFTPTSDLVYEGDETVTVSGTASGFTVEAVALTITDNETAPTTINLTLIDSDVGEEDGLTNVVVKAAWDGTSTRAVDTMVTISVAAGTGTAEDTDFDAVTDFDVTIAATTQSKEGTFSFTPTNDLVDEPNETVKVSGVASGFTVESVYLTITDNDNAPTVTLVLEPDTISESGSTDVSSTVTAMLSRQWSVDTNVTVSAEAINPAIPGDFMLSTNKVLTITALATTSTGVVTITSVGNNVDALDKQITIGGTSDPNFTVIPATLTITGEDVAVTVSLTSLDVDEGGSATYTVVLDTQPMANVLITITQSPQDRVTVDEASLRFTPVNWATPQTVTVSAQVDSDADNDMTVLSHRIGNSDTLARVTVTVTVNDRVTMTSLPMNHPARSAPLPVGYKATSNSYMDVMAPAGVTLDLYLPYDGNEGPPKLFHWDGTEWGALQNHRIEDNKVCGTATGFSPFAVFYRLPPLQLVLGATDQTATEDIPFRYQMPEATNLGGDPLTYTASLTDSNVLPDWLSFDGATRTFTGTPMEADTPATWNIEVTAADNGSPPSTRVTPFILTVEEVNDAPVFETRATNQVATEDIVFRYQTPAATDPEGDPLTYTTALTGGGNLPGWLTFDAATRTFGGLPRDTDTPATWNIEVTAADNDSPPLTGATTFTLTVENFDDSRLLEVANEWLARFGRTVTSHVMDSIGDRLADDAAHDKLTLAGESVPLGSASGTEAGSGLLADATNTDLRVFDDRFLDDGALGEWLLRDSDSRGITKRELLTGSSFHLTTTSVGDQGDGTGYDGAGRWTIWGGGLATRFEGRKSDDLPIDGEVLTGIAAFDWERDRWLAGMALSYSEGDGKFDVPAFGAVDAIQGTVESSLTAIHPYLRYRPRTGLEFWGMLGHGQGEMTLETAGDERATPDISMNMVGVGGRSALRSAQETGGPAVDMVGDVLLARTESEAAGDLKKAVSAKTTRVRLGLEGSWDWRLQDGSLLKPTLEAGLRHDGGDAENGFGLELGGGASWSDRRLGLTAELSGRMLLVHEDQDFREWGAGGSLRYDLGADGLGFTLGLSPTWGASDSGMDRLWSDRALPFGASDDLASSGHESGRLEGEVGYGLSAFGGVGRLTPYGGVELSDGNRDWRLGTRLEVGSSVDLRLEGARRERASESPEHSIGLRMRMTW